MKHKLIADEDKKIIGKAIKWLHVKRKLRIVDFIEGVCSKQTYNKMMKGNIVQKDEAYLSFLDKLGMNYNYEDSIMIHVHHQISLLNHSLNECDEKATKMHLDDCLNALTPYRNCMIEYLYYEALSLVYDYLFSPNKQLDKAIDLINIIGLYSFQLQQILMDYIFRITWNSRTQSRAFFNQLFSELPYEKSPLFSNRINRITHLLQNNKVYEGISELTLIIDDLKKQHNINLLLQCYVSKFKMVSYIQPQSILEMTQEVFTLIDDNYKLINQNILMNFYHNLGLYLCLNQFYDKASEMLTKSIQTQRYYYRSAVVLFYIERKSGILVDRELLNDHGRSEEGPDVLALYQYYRNIKIMSYEEKLDFLSHIVKKHYVGVGEKNLFYSITHDELMAAFDEGIMNYPENKESITMRKYNFQRRLKALVEHEVDGNETK